LCFNGNSFKERDENKGPNKEQKNRINLE